MSVMDKLKQMLRGHEAQSDQAIDKAGDYVDERTQNKYQSQVDTAQDKMRTSSANEVGTTRHSGSSGRRQWAPVAAEKCGRDLRLRCPWASETLAVTAAAGLVAARRRRRVGMTLDHAPTTSMPSPLPADPSRPGVRYRIACGTSGGCSPPGFT